MSMSCPKKNKYEKYQAILAYFEIWCLRSSHKQNMMSSWWIDPSPDYILHTHAYFLTIPWALLELWCGCKPSFAILSIVDQKFRLHALSSYMIFLLCSYLHLQTWRPATLGASCRRGVSGGVEGHHWEYNPFLVQSTVHTVFTEMLSSYMGRIKLQHQGAHIHCFYIPHITCCWQNFFDWYIRWLQPTRPTRKHVLPTVLAWYQS